MNVNGTIVKRKRVQVKKACVPCRKAHRACDEQRPCRRCVANGWADACVSDELPLSATVSTLSPTLASSTSSSLVQVQPQELILSPLPSVTSSSDIDGDFLNMMNSDDLFVFSEILNAPIQSSNEPSSTSDHLSSLLLSSSPSSPSTLLPTPPLSTSSDILAARDASDHQTLLSEQKRVNQTLETLQIQLLELKNHSQLQSQLLHKLLEQAAPLNTANTTTPREVLLSSDQAGSGVAESLWDVHSYRILGCNVPFCELVEYSMSEMSSEFLCTSIFPDRLVSQLTELFRRMADDSLKYVEAKCAIKAKTKELCVLMTLKKVNSNHVRLLMQRWVGSCDNGRRFNDFVYFPTNNNHSCDCCSKEKNSSNGCAAKGCCSQLLPD
jgi:hypothetical protein